MDAYFAIMNLPWEILSQLRTCRFCHRALSGEADPYCRQCGREQNLLPLAQQLLTPELYEEVRSSSTELDEYLHKSLHRMILRFRKEGESSRKRWQYCPKCGQMFED